MSSLRRAGLIGAGFAVGLFTGNAGLPPLAAVLDPILWFVFAVLASIGAFFGAAVVLAWRHVRESPRWLFGTFLGLLLLSQPVVGSFIRESRVTQRFLATADSVQGVVANKYVRGHVHLIVEYRAGGRSYRVTKTGANPVWGTPAYSQWKRGDSIPVYYQAAAPEIVLVGHPGPELRALLESLAKRWIIGGLLLTAYLPLLVRGLRRSLAVRWSSLQGSQI